MYMTSFENSHPFGFGYVGSQTPGYYDWGSVKKLRFRRIHPWCLASYFQSVIFVLDTPHAYGKSSNGGLLRRSTGVSPLRGSHATAIIACDGSQVKTLA
jgi:hypothetical protein